MPDDIRICNKLSGTEREYCVALANSCVEQADKGKSRIALDLMDGTTEYFDNSSECMSFAKFKASLGAPKNFMRKRANPSHRQGAIPRDLPKPSNTSHPAFEKCLKFGPVGSPANESCRNLLGICTSKETGPYSLPLDGKETPIDSQEECISLALFYLKMNNVRRRSASGGSTYDEAVWEVDNRTHFASTFADAGFSPEKADKIHIKPLTLLFNHDSEIRGIKIAIAYRLDELSDDTYSMRYRIYRDQAPKSISDDDLEYSFSFKIDGDHIGDTLAFGVTLDSDGDFGDIDSIKIAKLK